MISVTFLILFQLFIFYLCFGFYALFKNWYSMKNRMLFSLCINLSIWSFGYAFMSVAPNQNSANAWRIVAAIGWCLLFSTWLDFTIFVTLNNDKWLTNPKRLLIYIPSVFFYIANLRYKPSSVMIKINNIWKDKYPIDYIEILYITYYIAFSIAGILIIYKWGKNSLSKTEKKQAKIIVSTASISFFIGLFIDTLLPLLGIYTFSFGIISFAIALSGMFYTITKHKMMSITSKVANEYILRTMNDPVFLIKNDLLVTEANNAAIEMTGYKAEEMIGLHIQLFIADKFLNNQSIQELLKAGSVKNLEVGLLTKNHYYIPCLLSGSIIYNDLQEILGIACIFHDITDRKNAENAILEAHKELEIKVQERTAELEKNNVLLQNEIYERKKAEAELKANEERKQQIVKMESLGTLAGGIAHDFNNILAGIIGYTQLALEDIEDGLCSHDNLVEVLKLGERAKKLISQILSFSRKNPVEPRIIDIIDIIEELIKMLKTTIPSSIEIKYTTLCDCAYVFADPGEMQQLIMNLCVNAQLAMQNKGGTLQVILTEISVESRTDQYLGLKEGSYIRIQIADDGCGMDKSIIKRIFEPFYTTRGSEGGTGLGLSVAHGIIKRNGGFITVDSSPNKGSIFTVLLPTAKATKMNKTSSDIIINNSTARILLVDDEEHIVTTTQKLLQREGYVVTGISEVKKALKLFKSNIDYFDIVITDLTMPHITGDLFIKELHNLKPSLPIILCSGYNDKINNERLNSLNISEFLSKPVSKIEYIIAIEKIMQRKGNIEDNEDILF